MRFPTRIGTSQWDLLESRTWASSAGLYQSAGSGVAGSSGSRAPGMSAQRNRWKVRTWRSWIGWRE